MYHEPYRSWLMKFTAEYGAFLNTEDSWCEEYYQNAREDPRFQLDGDLYESSENWKTFNAFFARRLRDPAKRPIDAPEDERVVKIRLTDRGWKLREQVQEIPKQVGSCICLKHAEASGLYALLHKLLGCEETSEVPEEI